MIIDNKLLTIVIPCKNEGLNIIQTLNSIYNQNGIYNLDVIISDNSDDDITFKLILDSVDKYSPVLNIKIIKGGFPAEARANGANLVTSKYLLFLDADVELIGNDFLFNVLYNIVYSNKDLLTVKFKTQEGYNYIYRIFDRFQKLGVLLNSVFAVGGFQLWKLDAYNKTGGYLPELLFAEDYWLSSKVNKKDFIIDEHNYVYTSARRFKSKGIYYMVKMMILSYLNRNNIEFFKNHHNYWK
jgi:glycosyltransferase involved in cell wall biosynthesis